MFVVDGIISVHILGGPYSTKVPYLPLSTKVSHETVARRSLFQEVSYINLAKSSYRQLLQRSHRKILYRDLARTPLMETLHRDIA